MECIRLLVNILSCSIITQFDMKFIFLNEFAFKQEFSSSHIEFTIWYYCYSSRNYNVLLCLVAIFVFETEVVTIFLMHLLISWDKDWFTFSVSWDWSIFVGLSPHHLSHIPNSIECPWHEVVRPSSFPELKFFIEETQRLWDFVI